MTSCSQLLSSLGVRIYLLVLLAGLLPNTFAIAHAAEGVPEIEVLDQEIQRARARLTQVAAELREAKLLAAEKLLEFETILDQYQRDNSQVNANTMDHSQQRLALAEMGVESRTAKFERLQKKLEELGQQRQQRIGQPLEPAPPRPSVAAAQPPTPANFAPSHAVPETAVGKALALEPAPPAAMTQPILDKQGKLTDALELNAQLQKLERHLAMANVASETPVKVKAYGTAIPGELTLSALGGNQYFARFIAPAGQVSLIVGARLQQYHRSALDLEFAPEEQGKEFVLIFDLNQPDDPRALVFPGTMTFEQEMFAAHGDY